MSSIALSILLSMFGHCSKSIYAGSIPCLDGSILTNAPEQTRKQATGPVLSLLDNSIAALSAKRSPLLSRRNPFCTSTRILLCSIRSRIFSAEIRVNSRYRTGVMVNGACHRKSVRVAFLAFGENRIFRFDLLREVAFFKGVLKFC